MKKTTTKSKGLVIGCIIAALILAVIMVAVLLGRGEDPQPTVPTTQGTQPSQTPTSNPTVPTEPTTPTEPTEPTTPTEPATQPTEPVTQPTEPTTQPTEPTVPTEPPHEHEYTFEVVAPTCTEGGYTAYTCACGDTYIEDKVPATGHIYTEEVVEPTCEEGGYTTFTCTCGDTYKGNEVPALGHAWTEWEIVQEPTEEAEGKRQRSCSRCEVAEEGTIAKLPPSHKHSYTTVVTKPTCTAGGYTVYTCECGDTYRDDEVHALGHSFTNFVSNNDATCILDGTMTAECDRGCGEKHTVPDDGSALGCDYEAVETKPTCTEGGYTTYTCTRCNDSYVSDKVSALGHDFSNYISDGNATCDADGTKTSKCSRCDATDTVADPGSANGHNFGEWTTVIEPTEETEGKQERTCEACGTKEEQTIPKLNHEHKHTAVVTAPTCTEDGYTTYTCTCGDSYVADTVPALGHSYGNWITVKEATCTEAGEQEKTCSVCSDKQRQSITALGHDYKAVVTAPTCVDSGYTTHTCTRCNDSYEDTKVSALGHDFGKYISDGNATCDTDGTKTAKCSRCDVTDTITDTGSAKGHSYGEWVTVKEPTETEEGKQERICSACGAKEEKTIDKLNHQHAYTAKIVAATCTEQGYTEYTCSCGDSYKEDYVPALDHGYVKTVTDPTCTEDGFTTYTCSTCGHSYTDNKVAATGHTYGDWTVVKQPTCLDVGEEHSTCTICGAYESRTVDALSGMHTETWATITYSGTLNVRSGPGTSYSKLGTLKKGDKVLVLACEDNSAGQTWAKIQYENTEEAWIRVDGYASLAEQQVPNGHAWSEWKTEIGTSCADGSKRVRTCQYCDAKEEENLGGTSHVYTCWYTEIVQTCTSDGVEYRTCINCGEKETKVTEAGHDWGKWKTEDGKKIRTCSVCGAVETQEISSEPHYHTWATKEVEVTCTENGGTLWYCTTCGESSLTNTIWAAGHSWSDWETTKEPTTSSVGYEQRTCSTCGEVDVAAIPALDPKTGEKFEDSIDLSIKIDSDEKVTEYWYNSPNVQPSDGRVKDVLISDWREWESAAISIVVNENDTLTIVFYTKQGERVEITTEPPLEDFMYCVKIWEDGTYDCYYLGDFS